MAAILVVEDRPIDRRFLATLLKSAGHHVTEAADGIEALGLAEAAPPDLIISDILMPTVDGYEFVNRLREYPALSRTPVIFYTATYHEREARSLAKQCGVADVLTKPSDPDAILAAIGAVLRADDSPAPVSASQNFDRDHARVVSSALAAKIDDFEASEHRMTAIVEVAQRIAAERDSAAVMSTVCAAARDVTLAQQAAIGIVDGKSPEVRRLVTSGIDKETARRLTVPSLDAEIVAPVVRERRTIRSTNPSGRPEALGYPADHPATYSCLVVPIGTAHRVYGYLGLRNKLGADAFTDADERLALMLATLAAIAFENALFYEDLRTHAAALEQEVAERRRAETTVRENEARTHFALAAARMGVWECDFASGLMTWSATMAQVFGLTHDAVPRTSDEFFELIHSDDRASVREGIERALRDRADFVNEFRVKWPDGTIHWVAGHARPLNDTASSKRMIGVGVDIGERKSLEEQLRHAQKMEAIGQLAGGVAHDFNNLLTAIQGYAGLILSSLSQGDLRREDVEEILRASDRASGLTRQLLAFSRRQVLQPTLVDVNSLVRDTSKMLRRLIGEDVELVMTLEPNAAKVRADAGQLEQILMNLAVNARDAMPQGGRLSIETANVSLEESRAILDIVARPGPYVMLAVTDTGTGMDAETKQRIFEPFFTTKERGRGTGLGLATVYGIVKQSEGHIVVQSEPGRGAAFMVYLPQADEDRAATDAGPERVGPTGGVETVLLVEDERAVRNLSRILLERAGYRVLDAADPEKAETLFRKHADEIDLLMTDVVMPGSSGPLLFERLSAECPGLKVLYMSGYTDDAVVNNAGLSRDVVFLQKPFTADGMLCKIREALDR